MLEEKFQWNTSKFAMLTIDIDQGIHWGKNKVARNENWKKQLWVLIFIKYDKFWSGFAGTFHQAQTLKLGGVLLSEKSPVLGCQEFCHWLAFELFLSLKKKTKSQS